MKRFNYIFGIMIMSFLLMTSCEEKPRTFVEFKDLEKGAFARLLGTITGPDGQNFNFFNLAGSKVDFEVEFYDENNGKNVESYKVEVAHTPTATKGLIGEVSSANFGTSANGLPNTKFSITFQQVLTALKITPEQLLGGQRFEFACTIKMKDGRTFGPTNSASFLELPAFNNLMRFNVNLICPSSLNGSTATGAGIVYDYSTKGWCNKVKTGKLNLFHEGNGVHYVVLDGAVGNANADFSFGAYNVCYSPTATLPGGTLKLVDACGKLSFTGASRWGEIYTFKTIKITGASMELDWKNDYDPEAGVTTLTRSDCKPWPAYRR